MSVSNLEIPKCYICTEENIPLYKICSCADSFLCLDCLQLTEEKMNLRNERNPNRFKCDICRQDLTLYDYYGYQYFIKMIWHLSIRFLFSIIDFMPVIYIHYFGNTKFPSVFFTSNGNFIYISLLNILFFRNSFKFFLTSLYNIEPTRISFYYSMDIILSLITVLLFCFCLIKSSFQIIDLYAVLILILNYQLCFLIMWLMYTLDSLGNLIKQLKLKYQNYKILVLSSYFPIVKDEITNV